MQNKTMSISQISEIITFLVSRYNNDMTYMPINIEELPSFSCDRANTYNIIYELYKSNIIILNDDKKIIKGVTYKGINIGYKLSRPLSRYCTELISKNNNIESLKDIIDIIYHNLPSH